MSFFLQGDHPEMMAFKKQPWQAHMLKRDIFWVPPRAVEMLVLKKWYFVQTAI